MRFREFFSDNLHMYLAGLLDLGRGLTKQVCMRLIAIVTRCTGMLYKVMKRVRKLAKSVTWLTV